ncbi:hypothetical protein ABK040_004928 [Willaertia magna]
MSTTNKIQVDNETGKLIGNYTNPTRIELINYIQQVELKEKLQMKELCFLFNFFSYFLTFFDNNNNNNNTLQNFKKGLVNILISSNFNLNSNNKTLIIIPGLSKEPNMGMWSHNLTLEKGIYEGTQIPFIKKAQKEGYQTILLNPYFNKEIIELNENEWQMTDNLIDGHSNPEEHFKTVWKLFFQQYIVNNGHENKNNENIKIRDNCNNNHLEFKNNIYIMCHSYGGYIAMKFLVENYFNTKNNNYTLQCIAMGDSAHDGGISSLASSLNKDIVKEFLKNRVRNWRRIYPTQKFNLNLDDDLGEKEEKAFGGIQVKCSGTDSHSGSCFKAMDSIFKFFEQFQ